MELIDIKGVGKATVDKLNQLNIYSVTDLLMFMPTKYTKIEPVPISDIREGYFYTIKATYVKKLKDINLKKINLFAISVRDADGDVIEIEWFNQNYITKVLSIDKEYIFYGKAVKNKNKLILINPEFDEAISPKKLKGIRVEYRTKGLLTSQKINTLVGNIIDEISLKSCISDDISAKFNIPAFNDSIRALHFPINEVDLDKNLKRITLEKIVNLMLIYNSYKKNTASKRSFFYTKNADILSDAIHSLPYELTVSQKGAITKLVEELKGENNINYLLLGDVGSGKTIVSLLLCHYVIKNGGKAIFVVPSETLLNQHCKTAEFLQNFGVRIARLSGSSTVRERREVIDKLNSGKVDLLFGTHALINNDVNLNDFTFAVIDEQQKFGVNQKGDILKKLSNLDSLIMSATPIPRAISLMFNNDINVIEIYKAETRKTNVKTMLVPHKKIKDMFSYIANRAKLGEKTFVVCPNIESSENRLGTNDIYDYFKRNFDIKVLTINSKMAEDDKVEIMQKFDKTDANVLVATTIIEVGIDVQQARNMVILNSECFGLSSLHQLRGRVGRDGLASNCFLHYSELTDNAEKRLEILKNNTDGFMISKLDYELRGGGDIFGTKQSGKANGLIDSDMLDSELIVLGQQIFREIIATNADIDLDSLYNSQMLYEKLNNIVLA